MFRNEQAKVADVGQRTRAERKVRKFRLLKQDLLSVAAAYFSGSGNGPMGGEDHAIVKQRRKFKRETDCRNKYYHSPPLNTPSTLIFIDSLPRDAR